MKLTIGTSYLADQIIEKDGTVHQFDEKKFRFTVLPKPEKVIADDGVEQEEIDLSVHLTQANWYLVSNLKTGNRGFAPIPSKLLLSLFFTQLIDV